jgi:BirA family biotin operon repressor/biotin-[acetyl-CoA-carboxylase] ligase
MNDDTQLQRLVAWEQELEELHLGWPVFAFEETASTMDAAKELLATPPYLVLARKQRQGRGRGGKIWQAPNDSLKMTLVLPIHDRTKLAEGFSLFVGVEIARVLKRLLGVELRVKWPNDLFSVTGKKVGGILIETTSENRLLLGLGLNTVSIPTIREATSLHSLVNKTIPESHLLAAFIAKALVEQYQEFLSSGLCRKAWAEVGYGIGKHARVYDGESIKLQGTFLGITEKGEAIFETAKGVTTMLISGTLRFDPDKDELRESILHPNG